MRPKFFKPRCVPYALREPIEEFCNRCSYYHLPIVSLINMFADDITYYQLIQSQGDYDIVQKDVDYISYS